MIIFPNMKSVIGKKSGKKILVGGFFTSYDSIAQNYIARLNSNGTSDTSFLTAVGFNNGVQTIAVQSDGKIVAGGYFYYYNGTQQLCITRLNSDATLDTSFINSAGFSGASLYVLAITIQPDGKILVGGNFTSYNGATYHQIVRLNSDGTRDTSFVIYGGFFNYSTSSAVFAIAVQSDGKIVAGGSFTQYDFTAQSCITRINSNGSRDTGFTIGTGFNNTVNTIAIQSDGKIVVGGVFTSYNGTTQNYITRLNSDGTRDTSFTIGTGFNNTVSTIAIQSDGKIVVGGVFTSYNGTTQNYITRLNSDGTLDTGFTVGTGFNGSVNTIAIQSDGKIIIGGSFTSYNGTTQNRITRLNSDGVLDTEFTIGTGTNNTVTAISIT